MEKIILVVYVNVSNIKITKRAIFMKKVTNKLSKEEDGIISYFIPIENGETRIECLNPKLVSEEEFSKAKEILDKNQEIVNDIINNWKKD